MEDYASSDEEKVEEKVEKKIDFDSPKKNVKESKKKDEPLKKSEEDEVREMMRVPEPPKKKIVKKTK